ncbi:hypothetical protein V6N13_048013 [Hibiscus sabdariffa]|uniref:Uncharacterized protein n=1 Tax=Hibiscus sabdariffa TaxID=183260 RepID=A0ABR2F5X3_9ROSI
MVSLQEEEKLAVIHYWLNSFWPLAHLNCFASHLSIGALEEAGRRLVSRHSACTLTHESVTLDDTQKQTINRDSDHLHTTLKSKNHSYSCLESGDLRCLIVAFDGSQFKAPIIYPTSDAIESAGYFLLQCHPSIDVSLFDSSPVKILPRDISFE